MPELVIELPSVEAQRASFATWRGAPDPKGLRGTDPKQVEYYNRLFSSQQRLKAIGKQPVTIINLNPYKLVVIHPLFDGMDIAANKDGESYSAYVIQDVKYQVNTGLDHNHTPEEFWPVQLAQEFERQYAEKGGVFFINGDLRAHPELANTAEFKSKLHEATEQLYKYAFRMKTIGDNEWNTPGHAGAARNIHSVHRTMATILFKARKIAKMPDWIDVMTETHDIVPQCPVCKSEPKKGALVCSGCGYIIDPVGALAEGVITETHGSLERLTRAQVKALGVSAYVAETSDEVAKRRASGKSKPSSKFETDQMAAQAAEKVTEAKPKEGK